MFEKQKAEYMYVFYMAVQNDARDVGEGTGNAS
jgi:hypothetical protein